MGICSFYKGLSLKLQEIPRVIGSSSFHSVIHSYMHSLFARHLWDTCYMPGVSFRTLQRTRPTGSLPVENGFNSGRVWEAKTKERWHMLSGCFHGPLSRRALHPSPPCLVLQEADQVTWKDFLALWLLFGLTSGRQGLESEGVRVKSG